MKLLQNMYVVGIRRNEAETKGVILFIVLDYTEVHSYSASGNTQRFGVFIYNKQ